MARLALEKLNVMIIGVNRDTVASHKKFIEEQELDLLLLSDPEEVLCACYKVIKENNHLERSTFVFDEDGRQINEWRGVKVPGHVDEVMNYISRW